MARLDISDLLKRYEQKLVSGKSIYFDADEFDDLAEYFDAQSDIDSAREVIDDGLAIHPQSSSLLLKKAKFLVYDGEYSKALLLLNDTFSEYDFDLYLLKVECCLQMNLNAEAYLFVKTILENEDEELDTVLAEIGFLYVEADLFAEAVLYLEKSLEYDAEKIDVLGDLAYVYEMQGDFQSAIVSTNKILDLDPYTYEAWVNLGKLYSLQDEFGKAVDAFDFALTINDSDANVLKLRAHCLSLCNRATEAIEIFKELVEVNPTDTSLYFLLAECYQLLGMSDEALSYMIRYSDAIELVSGDGALFMGKGDLAAAFDIVQQGLINDEHSVDLNILAGDIKVKQELYLEAEAYFLKAYAMDENNLLVLDRLSVVNIKKEDYQTSVRYANRILLLEPDNFRIKERLALLYFELDELPRFNSLLEEFANHELNSLFNLIYSRKSDTNLNREELIRYLISARESRILFNNIHF